MTAPKKTATNSSAAKAKAEAEAAAKEPETKEPETKEPETKELETKEPESVFGEYVNAMVGPQVVVGEVRASGEHFKITEKNIKGYEKRVQRAIELGMIKSAKG